MIKIREELTEKNQTSDNSIFIIDLYGHDRQYILEENIDNKKYNTSLKEHIDIKYLENKKDYIPRGDYDSDSDTGKCDKQIKNKFNKSVSLKWVYDSAYNKKYVIDIFGIHKDGNDICIHVLNYEPYFYISIPKGFTAMKFKLALKQAILNKNYCPIIDVRYIDCITSITIENKRDYLAGFCNNETIECIKMSFNNDNAKKSAKFKMNKPFKILDKDVNVIIYDCNIDSVIKFIHSANLNPAGWNSFKNFINIIDLDRYTTCYYEVSIDWEDITKIDETTIPGILTCSFDIECYSHDLESFPNYLRKEDKIIQINSRFKFENNSKIYNVMIVLGPCESLQRNDLLIKVESEKFLIIRWRELIRKLRPDIITGYYISGFDFNYIYERSKLYGVAEIFLNISKIRKKICVFEDLKLSSGAFGDNNFKYPRTPGCITIDMLKVMQAQLEKLSSYKLDSVCELYLNQKKDDIKPTDIFRYYSSKDPKKVATIANYCIQDTDLVLNLMLNRRTLLNSFGMANVCYIPLSYIFYRGTGIKVLSILTYMATKENFIIRTDKYISKNEETETDEKVKGAFVMELINGFYEDVVTLDFSSLYPSIMMAYNLSHDTIVENPIYDNLDNYTYKDIKYYMKDNTKKKARYVQNYKGLLPKILEFLISKRKEMRNISETENKKEFPNKNIVDVFDALQLAYKVICNSCYGLTNAKGMMKKYEITGCTTAKGQEIIKFTKNFVDLKSNYEDDFDMKVVYGDSITGDMPIVIRFINNEITVLTIEELFKKYYITKNTLNDKDIIDMSNNKYIDVLTSNGFTRIDKIIRHKVNKRIYKVSQNSGYVNVTEDHSLITNYKKVIKPHEITKDTVLLSWDKIAPESLYNEKYNYINTRKHLHEILNSSMEMRKLFCNNYSKYNGDDLVIKQYINLIVKSIYPLADCDEISIEEIKYNKDIYVYDLETKSHEFAAGLGNIVVHNTDSVFIEFKFLKEYNDINDRLKFIFDYSKNLSSEITKSINRKPLNLEFEKVFIKLLLFTKKRYNGIYVLEPNVNKYKTMYKGTALKRRDVTGISKIFCQGITDLLLSLNKYDEKNIHDFINKTTIKMYNDEFDISEFTKSAAIKKLDSYKTDPPHVIIAKRVRDRDPGNAFNTNDRVEYVFKKINDRFGPRGGKIKNKKSDQAEYPPYFIENGDELDYDMYLKEFIAPPLIDILKCVFRMSESDALKYMIDLCNKHSK